MAIINVKDLKEHAQMAGLTIWGWSPATALNSAAAKLRVWQERNYHGEMEYMARDSDKLSDPRALLEDASSVITVAALYPNEKRAELPPGYGRVARYAWGRDYHTVLRERLKVLADKLSEQCGGDFRYRAFSDSVPLLERAFGEAAGLGFVGKNTMLIRPKIGSYFFLAEIISNLEIREEAPLVPVRGRCGECQRCLVSCPTGALSTERPGTLDARLCISYLSIEKRGMLTDFEMRSLGEWIFGCDICQECCPFNHAGKGENPQHSSLQEFRPSEGIGRYLKLDDILQIREEKEFKSRFAGSPLLRTKREGLLRNCAAVAGNTKDLSSVAALFDCIREDKSPVVRETSLWALDQLKTGFSSSERSQWIAALDGMRLNSDERLAGSAKVLLRRLYE